MSTRDTDRLNFLALKLRAGVPLSPAEQAEWNRDATWRDRLPLLASRLREGLPLSEADQAYWNERARWSDKVAAGLPLTAREEEQCERAKEAIVTVRTGGVLVVEDGSKPQTVEDWKQIVAKSRGTPVNKLVADALPSGDKTDGTDKPQT